MWYVLRRDGADRFEPLSEFLERDTATLGYVSAGDCPALLFYSDGPVVTFIDTEGAKHGASHYQIAQYYAYEGNYSPLIDSDPAEDLMWENNSTLDHLVKLTETWIEDVPVASLNIVDAEGIEHGRLAVIPTTVPLPQRLYLSPPDSLTMSPQYEKFKRTRVLEVSGDNNVLVERALLVKDIAPNNPRYAP
jgi:hypothetical protein